jgi:hypothetical protein
LKTSKRCFGGEGKCGLEGINFVNRGGWRDNIVRLSEAITVSGLINSTPNPSGASLLYSTF